MDDIRKWVKEKYLVKILTMSSFEASTLLSQSNLTLEQLFQPFCEISHSFSVRSLSKTLTCNNLKVQVFEKLELKRNESILNSNLPHID